MIRKYPRTRHVVGSRLQGGDEDLEAVPFSVLKGRRVVVEEKMDGANSGVSFDAAGMLRLQSRGHFLTGGGRERDFALFKQWAGMRAAELGTVLGKRYVMYGEWMYAKHTVFYDALPHYFLEFDMLDTETGDFLDMERRRALLSGLPIVPVRVLFAGELRDERELKSMLGASAFKTEACEKVLRATAQDSGVDVARAVQETDLSPLMEGLYIKVEEDGVVKERLKFVRADFVTRIADSNTHWLDRPIVANQLRAGVDLFGEMDGGQ